MNIGIVNEAVLFHLWKCINVIFRTKQDLWRLLDSKIVKLSLTRVKAESGLSSSSVL